MTFQASSRRAVAAAWLATAAFGGLGLLGSAVASAQVPRAAAPASAAVTAKVLRNVAYGPHARHKLDVYLPARAMGPVLLMVHGGAWVTGDKAMPATILPKAARWNAEGYVVVSANYRLLPEAGPLEQADDVAKALAFVQREAAGWGGDGKRVALMGHSAGGHLVALLNAQPALAQRQGAQPWRGTVVLDSAALDVVALMEAPHAKLYDRAFGTDPAYWKAVSPLHVLAPKVPPVLFICSKARQDACPQADAYERKGAMLKHNILIWTSGLNHLEINRQLGEPGAYTDSVGRWISSIL